MIVCHIQDITQPMQVALLKQMILLLALMVAMLHLEKLGVELEELNLEQANYIGVNVKGPFKNDSYKY